MLLPRVIRMEFVRVGDLRDISNEKAVVMVKCMMTIAHG